jgi:hypothetical protein
MMRTLARIIVSPYYRVQFRDFFVADELNSFIYFLSSLQLFVCVYVNRLENLQSQCEVSKSFISPAVNMAPALFRLLQCLRQYRDSDKSVRYLFNAGKYGCIIAAAWFSTWYNIYRSTEALALWILISIVATFYGYIWDVIFDWGCFQRNSKNRLLRDELTYRKGFYYFGLVSNFIGRIGWVLLVSVGFWGTGSVRGTVVYIVALIELFRRFQWNFYRMENEHLNNVDGFRVVRDIPLPLDEFGIQGTDFVEHHAADDGQHSQFNSHNITTHSQTLANHASSILEEGHMKK